MKMLKTRRKTCLLCADQTLTQTINVLVQYKPLLVLTAELKRENEILAVYLWNCR